jgi:predicted porin
MGTAENEERTGKSIGVAFAATKELSVGYTQTKADTSANAIDEETKIFAVGYNFGPVALAAQYQKVDNAGSVATNDGDIVRVRLSTAF